MTWLPTNMTSLYSNELLLECPRETMSYDQLYDNSLQDVCTYRINVCLLINTSLILSQIILISLSQPAFSSCYFVLNKGRKSSKSCFFFFACGFLHICCRFLYISFFTESTIFQFSWTCTFCLQKSESIKGGI